MHRFMASHTAQSSISLALFSVVGSVLVAKFNDFYGLDSLNFERKHTKRNDINRPAKLAFNF